MKLNYMVVCFAVTVLWDDQEFRGECSFLITTSNDLPDKSSKASCIAFCFLIRSAKSDNRSLESEANFTDLLALDRYSLRDSFSVERVFVSSALISLVVCASIIHALSTYRLTWSELIVKSYR